MNQLVFSPNAQDGVLASGGQDGSVVLINLLAGEPVTRTLVVGGSPVISLGSHPDGKNLLVSKFDGTVRLWDLKTGQSKASGLEALHHIIQIVFNPLDGGRTVFVSHSGKLDLWDLASKKLATNQLEGNTNDSFALALSPNGKILAQSACAEHDRGGTCAAFEVRLWDVLTRHTILQVPLGESTAPQIFFDKKSGSLVMTDRDRLLDWTLDPNVWEQGACHTANRNLTHEEWGTYINADDSHFVRFVQTCPSNNHRRPRRLQPCQQHPDISS